MASIFSSTAPVSGVGPLANAQDYTKALGYQGMGPVASGQQYGQFLQSQQPGILSQFANAGKSLESFQKAQKTANPLAGQQTMMPMMQLQQQRPTGPLQATDLLSLLSNLGGY
jgi:hypothetical protein